jgi:hypothetical protein
VFPLRALRLGVIPALAATLTGCFTSPKTFQGQDLPIDSKVLISMTEHLSPAGRTLELECKTERSYGCSNLVVLTSMEQRERAIQIQFRGIRQPEICLTSFGPATTRISLGSLAAGSYRLAAASQGQGFYATLSVSEQSYAVTNADAATVGFSSSQLNRVPDHTIWGLIGYIPLGAPSDSVAQSFLDSLRTLGAANSTWQPGDYGYFSIDASGDIETPQNHGYYFARPFIFDYSGSQDALRALVSSYGQRFAGSVNIQVKTWQGREYLSWWPYPIAF